jgi:hypothetical protein
MIQGCWFLEKLVMFFLTCALEEIGSWEIGQVLCIYETIFCCDWGSSCF